MVLTIDAELENVMAEALQDTITTIHSKQEKLMNARWRERNAEILKEYAEQGKSISLAETGAMVAMDPYTGKVLGMVSLPSYDLSIFNDGQVDMARWTETLEGNDPLYNRAISTKDAPGSIFKMTTALGALAEER